MKPHTLVLCPDGRPAAELPKGRGRGLGGEVILLSQTRSHFILLLYSSVCQGVDDTSSLSLLTLRS